MKGILCIILALLTSSCGFFTGEVEQTMERTQSIEVSDKGVGWGINKNKNSAPDVPQDVKAMLPEYDAFYMDNSGEKTLYLTFDEGYENGYTAKILDILKNQNVPAAFFVTGAYFDRETELVKRMVEEGHIVGNHTENHPNLHKLADDEKISSELRILDAKFYEKFGQHMKYMRPPEGEYSERVLSVAKRDGYKTAFWSFAYKDWLKDSSIGADAAFNSIAPYLHDGCVILLHAVSKDNADCLERLIMHARESGYEFKSLDHIKL